MLLINKCVDLSGAYARLTQPGLYASDPLERFLDIHRDIDLSSLSLHMDNVQALRDTVDWDEIFALRDIYRHIARRKRGKAADRYGNRNEFVKYLIDDPQYLELLRDVILIPMAKGHSNFSSKNPT